MQSIIIGIVVRRTMKQNTKVHIGSTILAEGHILIHTAAIITPIDWNKSPITWTKAALIFKFSALK
jgi:hypothetical protein